MNRPMDSVTVCFTDHVTLDRDRVHWQSKGVILDTKWYFEQGTELEFAVERGATRRVCVGTVVSCTPHPNRNGVYETSIYFVDSPCREMMEIWSKINAMTV